jgi:hypothetical protein
LSVFKSGERVRIVEVNESNKIYKIKKIRITKKGGILYLLKSLEKNSSCECIMKVKNYFWKEYDEKVSQSTFSWV